LDFSAVFAKAVKTDIVQPCFPSMTRVFSLVERQSLGLGNVIFSRLPRSFQLKNILVIGGQIRVSTLLCRLGHTSFRQFQKVDTGFFIPVQQRPVGSRVADHRCQSKFSHCDFVEIRPSFI